MSYKAVISKEKVEGKEGRKKHNNPKTEEWYIVASVWLRI